MGVWVPLPVLLSLPFILLPLIVALFNEYSKRKLRLPPGPPELPFIGNLHQVGPFIHRDLRSLAKRYGPIFRLRLGWSPAIVVSSSSVAQEVLKIQDSAFCSRPPLTTFRKYANNGFDVALSPYGDSWRNLRRIMMSELLGPKKISMFSSIREEETCRLVDYIATRPNPNSTLNMSELAVHLASNVVYRTGFGKRSGGGFGERSPTQEMFREGNTLLASFYMGDQWPGLGWIDSLRGLNGRLERNAKDLDSFYQELIDEHLDAGRRGEDYEEDVLDVMIRLWKDDKSDLKLEHIKGALMNIIIGATDTSAAALVWTMAELVQHPTAMKKAQDELRSLLGNKGKVQESDLPQVQYLKLVINEALRLHAPLPLLIPRETIRDCKINGYDICAHTKVFVNAWAIGRDEDSWKNPEEFIPERFIGSTIDYKEHNFQFIPFGAGRRTCPGMNFGITMVELVLANLLYAFNWELPSCMEKEGINMDEAPGLVLHKKLELYLVAKNNI